MSKTKTKQARRQLKRDGARKIAEHQKKEAKKAAVVTKPLNPRATIPTPRSAPVKHNPHTDPKETATKHVQASQKHTVPFGVYEHILLVGEGDFSFTRSLVEDHGCANVTATSFDTEDEVLAKYLTFAETRDALQGLTPPVPLHHGIDAAALSSHKALKCTRDDEDDEDAGVSGWDTIVFMFPHTGGLSTDVNRQVRSNQALLVSFFKACLETSTPKQRLRILEQQANRPNLVQRTLPAFLKLGGRIIVSLFEGAPYSLWNIRDLARHAGLKVVESYKLDWAQYPAYKHVRTLGALEGGGAWKGEEREARVYVFEKVRLEADSDEEKELEKRGVKVGKRRGVQTQVPRKKRRVEDGDSE